MYCALYRCKKKDDDSRSKRNTTWRQISQRLHIARDTCHLFSCFCLLTVIQTKVVTANKEMNCILKLQMKDTPLYLTCRHLHISLIARKGIVCITTMYAPFLK